MTRFLLAALVFASATLGQAAEPKVLRYAFEIAETSFDPNRISDIYSNIVINGIYEAPLTYDYLAHPLKVVPNLTEMPDISADGTTHTSRVRPGLYYADDPGVKGKKPKVAAQDFV